MKRYFIADLHLQPERPDITRAFLYFLEEIIQPGDSLYLLGDIFEYWIGDDAPLDGMEPALDKLEQLSNGGSEVFFQHGNRDFLVGEAFAKRIGATLLPEALVIELNSGPALLMHGDQLCTDDEPYQQFRTQVRNPDWQQQFLSQPVEQRRAIAEQMRAQSKAQGAMKAETIMDVNAEEVSRQMRQHGVEVLIHGHTHRPAIHPDQIAPGIGKRIVLGDWGQNGWYLVESEATTNLELIEFTPV
ncbi:UDP-2,3-diacylglucosamine diphosphatase [Marinobacterium lutimaris]|uniref:UDP-2,3-diacylglucosamine hydrolase n=1 Tax=Marinobacterium lutimaris TaxID=568106 RepID=A0A1H5USS2_9GAMM|nr:UDP-2,3-diacylglucosamine diphosphatase [Marinobacterium lutimaris]SEF78056.1 UDP-2,3-diacylglucosamine hydrolase [Marinobacterium lutimaris]